MKQSSIYIQTIASGAGLPFSVVEKIMVEAAAAYNRVEEIVTENGHVNSESNWKAGFYHGLERALVIAGANEVIVSRCLDLILYGEAGDE